MTTKQDIEDWKKNGKKLGADYLIVVCDTFDYEDYPVYCKKKDLEFEKAEHSKNMQRIMEVIKLK